MNEPLGIETSPTDADPELPIVPWLPGWRDGSGCEPECGQPLPSVQSEVRPLVQFHRNVPLITTTTLSVSDLIKPMKTTRLFTLLASASFLAPLAHAQVPSQLSYQGRVAVGGTNFNGSGQFKFALVNNNGTTSFWSNNGTSAAGSEPSAAVALSVASGLYSVQLGDVTLPNMAAIPFTVFTNSDVRLRVWFNDGVNGSQLLTPDQRITAVGYSMMAANVPDGSITALKLAPGAVQATNLPPNSIGSDQIANTIALGATNVNGRLDVYRTAAGTPGVSLFGSGSQISTYGSDGLEQTRLWGGTYGELLLNNSLANNATAVRLTAQGSTGGQLELRNTNGVSRALLEGENTGGLLTLYAADGGIGAVLYGNEGQGSGALSLRNTNASPRLRAYGGPGSGSFELYDNDGTRTFLAQGAEGTSGSQLLMYENDGSIGLQLDAENGTGGGGYIAVYEGDGTAAIIADANTQGGVLAVYEQDGTATAVIHNVSDAGVLSMRNSAGTETGYFWGRNTAGQTGGQIGLKNSAGVETITLDADRSGDGRIITQVLQITGGSDLSEQFDIKAIHDELKAGMIVSIDPEAPGRLMTTTKAYDKTVAGIISGAGGVQTGMLMGQRGTAADGKHAVALTGRVYCWVDASKGSVRPGDLITTSDTPGHGMKVKDHRKAQGAVIGKAMSSLDQGKGLVLVLVSMQ